MPVLDASSISLKWYMQQKAWGWPTAWGEKKGQSCVCWQCPMHCFVPAPAPPLELLICFFHPVLHPMQPQGTPLKCSNPLNRVASAYYRDPPVTLLQGSPNRLNLGRGRVGMTSTQPVPYCPPPNSPPPLAVQLLENPRESGDRCLFSGVV